MGGEFSHPEAGGRGPNPGAVHSAVLPLDEAADNERILSGRHAW